MPARRPPAPFHLWLRTHFPEAMSQHCTDECAHDLWHGLNGDVLHHKVSGATMDLEGRFQLKFDDQGKGYLTSVDGSAREPGRSKWITGLLDWQLYEELVDQGGEGARFLYNLKTTKCIWLSDLPAAATSTTKGLELVSDSFKHSFLVYISPFPKGGACLRWALPNVIDLVVGSGFDGRWISRHLLQMKSVLRAAGVPEDHLVRSLWSAKFSATRNSDMVNMGPTEDEFCVCTEGLLAIILSFTVGRTKMKGATDCKEVVAALISALASRAAPGVGAPWQATWQDGMAELQWVDGSIALVRCEPHAKWHSKLQGLLQGGKVGRILVGLKEKLQRPCRIKGQVDCATALMLSLSQAVAHSVEASRGEPFWDETRPSQVPALFKDGSSKARRVGIGYVLDVVDAVNASPELRNPGQLLAAQAAGSSKAVRGRCAKVKFMGNKRRLMPKTAQKFVPKKMTAYRVASVKRFKKSKYISVALDALRAGGAEWCQYACTDPDLGVSCWWPPQACLGGAWVGQCACFAQSDLLQNCIAQMSLCPAPFIFPVFLRIVQMSLCPAPPNPPLGKHAQMVEISIVQMSLFPAPLCFPRTCFMVLLCAKMVCLALACLFYHPQILG